jgi:lysophospholipid acyltransferase (LPLAT)-like uncharacterized protein
MSTLDYKVMYADPTIDAVHPHCAQRYIYLMWHEYLIFGAYLRGGCGLTVLASRHRDGQLMADIAARLGWNTIAGSSTRGGVAAVVRMLKKTEGHLSLTPDGPRGPRRTMAMGAIFLASRSGMPLVCSGHGYDRAWRVNSWDRFAIPRPFSRARAVSAAPIFVPPDLDREGLEHYRRQVEATMQGLTERAEQWAISGEDLPGQFRLYRGRLDPKITTSDDPHSRDGSQHDPIATANALTSKAA